MARPRLGQNEIWIAGPNSYYIKLTKGKWATIGKRDYQLISEYRWIAHKSGKTWYAVAVDNREYFQMHRVILGCIRGEQVDHKDGNGLNNMRGNIRKCTVFQNMQNRGKHRPGTSKHKGVSFRQAEGTWRAAISFNGKRLNLGTYAFESDAAIAYNKAAKKHHGKFAYQNKVEGL